MRIKSTLNAAISAGLALAASAHGQVTQVGGTLQVFTGPNNDSFKLVVPSPGVVETYGVPGVRDGRRFFGVTSIDVRTNLGNDKVAIESFVVQPPTIFVDAGPGHNEVDIDLLPPTSMTMATSNIRVLGGSGEDKCFITVTNFAASMQNTWDIALGDGVNDTLILVDSDQRTSAIRSDLKYLGGVGVDKVYFDTITDQAAVVLGLNVATGAGQDEVIVRSSPIRPSTVQVSSDIRMGPGSDTAGLFISNPGTSATLAGSISGGDADDIIDVLVEGTSSGDPILGGGAGNDLIKWDVKRSLLGSMRIFGGPGDDFVSSFVEGAGVNRNRADGGPGIDSYVGRGVPINFESVN